MERHRLEESDGVSIWKETLTDGSDVFDVMVGNIIFYPADEQEAWKLYAVMASVSHDYR